MIARIRGALALVALLSAPAMAEPFHHPAGEWREYHRDWLAACPDTINEDGADYYSYSCFASTGSKDLNRANLPAYELTLFHNRLNGELDLAITVAADGTETDTSRPLTLSFHDGSIESFDFASDLEIRHNITNQFYLTDPARKTAVIERMKERNVLVLGVPLKGAAGSKNVQLSLRGVIASLDFMTAHARRVTQY